MSKIYCLDASVFINCWTKHYPFDVFPCVWECLDNLMYREQAIIPQMVFEEIEKGQDDLLDWLNFYRRDCVIRPDLDRLRASKAIVQAYPRLLETKKNRSRSGADPFVIGFAQAGGATVVTDERASNNIDKPKIPDICRALNIECIGVVDLLRQCGIECCTAKGGASDGT